MGSSNKQGRLHFVVIGGCLKKILIAGATSLVATPALAGGFYLQEQSPGAIGRAFAGEAAIASDASTVFFNPAGMTRLGRVTITNGVHILSIGNTQSDQGSTRTEASTGVVTATGGGEGGNPFDQPVLIPAGFGAIRVGDRPLWLGLSVTAPFGQKLVYNNGWFGRYDSIVSDLKTFNFQPSAAYALSDKLSIGVGIDIQLMDARLSNALPGAAPSQADGLLQVDGTDTALGWNAGILLDLDDVRLGAHYRSGIKHDLKGRLTVSGLEGALAAANGDVSSRTRVKVPGIATASIVAGANRLRLLASASWYDWSVFRDIRIVPEGAPPLVSEQRYKDTWSASLGAEYDARPGRTLRLGMMRDGSPTRDGFRSTRVPGGDRYWLSTGASLALNRHLTTDLSYAHIFVKRADIARTDAFYEGTAAETLVTTRSRDSGNVDMLAAAITARF